MKFEIVIYIKKKIKIDYWKRCKYVEIILFIEKNKYVLYYELICGRFNLRIKKVSGV